MRRFITSSLAIFLLLALAACGSSTPTQAENTIGFAKLTAEQQEIMDLLSVPNTSELLIFDYEAKEGLSNMEVWVEIYQNGALVERPATIGTLADKAIARSGRIAIIIQQNPKYQWTLSVVENGGRSSYIGTADTAINAAVYGRAYGPLEEAGSLEDGKEIILYRSLFSSGGINAYDCKTLQDNPDLLKEYDYAHIIKCKFTK